MKYLRNFRMAMAAALMCLPILFASCSKDEDTPTTTPTSPTTQRDRARYTVMVYGNAGGRMDYIIEDMWEQLKPMLNDSTDVRMVFLYKYGANNENFSGRYGNPGDVVWFELNSQTNLDSLKYSSALQAPNFPLYEPYMLANYIKAVKQRCPADNYIFVLWGHGGGYDIVRDRPNHIVAKGVLYDELAEGKGMTMYEFADGLATAGNTHFPLIMFHNCLMGNIETVTEVQQYADYFFVSSHVLESAGEPIMELVKAIRGNDDYNFEHTAARWFGTLRPIYDQFVETATNLNQSLDFKVIRSSGLENLNVYLMGVAGRLVELYSDPVRKAEIDTAAAHYLYTYHTSSPYLVDLDHYMQTLGENVGDDTLRTYCQQVRTLLDEMIIQRWHYTIHPIGFDDYSLSIVFGNNQFLHTTVRGNTIASAYYPSVFNRRTGWAEWLNTNTFLPERMICQQGGLVAFSWQAYLDIIENL